MLRRLLLPFASLLLLLLTAGAVAQPLPATGVPVPELAAFDREIADLMTRYDVPGGALAISYRGRLVLARGYGFGQRELGRVVQPWTSFRIASVSKPVTAAAVLRLHEQGRLKLDDRVVDHLRDLLPPAGPRDARVERITIRDLLQHSGGWDAEALGTDMQFDPWTIARTLASPRRPPLPTSPGTRSISRCSSTPGHASRMRTPATRSWDGSSSG